MPAPLDSASGAPEIRLGKPLPITRPVFLPHGEVVRSAAPCDELPHTWIGLCASGALIRVHTISQAIEVVGSIEIPLEPDREPWNGHVRQPRIVASSDGEYVAVVNDFGSKGLVVRIADATVTMDLDGGSYCEETVPFSVCFAFFRGRPVLVHRTDWNRLDISDPVTGTLLTDRGPTSYASGEQEPPHYLDYFHGRLTLSPNGSQILDDGWVWHPVGIPVVWSLQDWLSGAIWESEDGDSYRQLRGLDYHWNRGMCWVDERRVAVVGIGIDGDRNMLDGVTIYDIQELRPPVARTLNGCNEVAQFAGPRGELYCDGAFLYASDKTALALWDVNTGAHRARLENFHAFGRHPKSGEFLGVSIQEGGNGLSVWEPPRT
jgi:hypothetical protein